AAKYDFARTDVAMGTPMLTTSAQVAAFSILAVIILKFWDPMRFVHIFQGDYLSLLLLLGIALLAWHRKGIAATLRVQLITLLTAALAALMLHFLVMGWFEITMTETWLIAARWLRFPAVLLAVLPFHLAEEILLGSVSARSPLQRLA